MLGREDIRLFLRLCLWKWLPHSFSKCQSPTTVFLRTPVTQMIFFSPGIKTHASCLVEPEGENCNNNKNRPFLVCTWPKHTLVKLYNLKNHLHFSIEVNTLSSFVMRVTLRYPSTFWGTHLGNKEIKNKNDRFWFAGMHQMRTLKFDFILKTKPF